MKLKVLKIQSWVRKIKRFSHISAGQTLVLLGILTLVIYFYPLILIESNYYIKNIFSKENNTNREVRTKPPLSPIDPSFSVLIPKIGVNAKIIPDIDPYNIDEYKKALSVGVAHAKGTSYPDREGNIFIFAHSTSNSVDVSRYNAIFYLLEKLEMGERIYIVYKDKTYEYQVTEKKIIDPSEIQYLESNRQGNSLTLMTCWPAGTSLKRLLIIGQKVS